MTCSPNPTWMHNTVFLLNDMQFFAFVAIPPGYQNRFTIDGTGSTGKRYTASLSQVAAINRNNLQELEIIIKVSKRLLQIRLM